MKNFPYLRTMAIAALCFSLTSCTEDQLTSSPISVDTAQVATVNGVAYAELNLQNAGKEFAPVGTKLLVTIPYSQLNPAATQGNWEKMITVGENGAYSVELPSTNKGVMVTITPTEFIANLILEQNSQNSTKKTIYSSNPVSTSVKKGLTTFIDITYYFKSQEMFN